MKCYLLLCSDMPEDAEECSSIAAAVRSFQRTAEVLDRYGQRCDATIHFAIDDHRKFAEYPDYVLSLGPRGGIVKERT